MSAADVRAAHCAERARALLAAGNLAGALALLRSERQAVPAVSVTLADYLLFFVADAEAVDEAVSVLLDAEPELPAAAYRLAWLGLGGVALPLDFDQIEARLQRAAAAGHLLALRALALAAARVDTDQAGQLLDRGARSGDPVAGLLLAERWRRSAASTEQARQLSMLERGLAAAGYPPLPAVAEQENPAAIASGAGLAGFASMPTATPLCQRPRVQRIEGLLSADECRFLIAMARPLMKRSTVHDPSTGAGAALPVRTSSDASFDVMQEDAALRLLSLRLAQAAGHPLAHAEPLIVLHYRPGEAYRPHRDYLSPSALAASRPEAGQRSTTICTYLNPVESGGATTFPLLDLRSEAKPGAAVIFDNLDPEGEPEPRSLHAGERVQRGEKWLATLWLRQRPLRLY